MSQTGNPSRYFRQTWQKASTTPQALVAAATAVLLEGLTQEAAAVRLPYYCWCAAVVKRLGAGTMQAAREHLL
jgi:hypothetical protein